MAALVAEGVRHVPQPSVSSRYAAGVHQRIRSARSSAVDLEQPALAVRILVQQLGLSASASLTTTRCPTPGHTSRTPTWSTRAHRSDSPAPIVVADCGQIDVDDVTERILREIGDADPDPRAVVETLDPLVFGGVPKILGDVHAR